MEICFRRNTWRGRYFVLEELYSMEMAIVLEDPTLFNSVLEELYSMEMHQKAKQS